MYQGQPAWQFKLATWLHIYNYVKNKRAVEGNHRQTACRLCVESTPTRQVERYRTHANLTGVLAPTFNRTALIVL